MNAPHYIFGLLLAFLLAGCHSTSTSTLDEADYPGTLQRPTVLGVEAAWQQTVTASWQQPQQGPRSRSFPAALQCNGEELTVIGLSPMGSVGFSIQQGPDGIALQNNIPDQLVIPPRFILIDVQRAFFPWLGPSMEAGERVGRVAGEEIVELWQDGHLKERLFRRCNEKSKGAITVRYEWGQGGWTLPTSAVLDNGWLGYQLHIVTHSETRLGTATATSAEGGR